MYKNFSFLFVLMLLSGYCFTQKGTIEGAISDADSNLPINGAYVNIGDFKDDNTDVYGKFLITSINPGQYELVISHIGYKKEIIPVEVKPDIRSSIKVNLKRDNLKLSEVVINSKKNNNLNTLSGVDILLRPVTTSQDILRIIPGLFIAQHAGGGKAEQIFLRGADLDHGTDINITVDGMPVNMVSHAHGQGYADLHFLIPETLEKVTFDKGPYFANKGNFATTAYAEFNTREFLEKNMIKVEAGQFNTFRTTGLFKIFNKQTEKNKQQLYVASELSATDGYFESPQNFHRLNVLGKYTSWFGNQSKLILSASFFNSKWDASGQIPERAVENGTISRFGSIDNSEGGNTGRTNFNVQFNKQWKNNWKTTDQLYFTKYHFNLYSNFTFFLKDSVNGDAINQNENRSIFGYNTTASKSWYLGRSAMNTELGGGFRLDNIPDIELSHVRQRKFLNTIQKGAVKESNLFFYVSQEIALNSKLNLTTGIRYDYFKFRYKDELAGESSFKTQQRGILNPKLNFSYQLNQRIKLYFNNGFGFHSNDTRVILNNQAKDILPRVFGSDFGVYLKPVKNLVIKSAIWYLYSQQEFVYVGDEGIVEPSGKSRRAGIDVSGRYQFTRWLFGDVDINFTKARAAGESKGKNYIPLAPSFTSLGGLTVKSESGITGAVRYRYIADRPANEDYSVTARGYCITDFIIGYQWKNIAIRTSVENIFNIDWNEAQFLTESRLKNELNPVEEIHFTPGIPRNFKIFISYSF